MARPIYLIIDSSMVTRFPAVQAFCIDFIICSIIPRTLDSAYITRLTFLLGLTVISKMEVSPYKSKAGPRHSVLDKWCIDTIWHILPVPLRRTIISKCTAMINYDSKPCENETNCELILRFEITSSVSCPLCVFTAWNAMRCFLQISISIFARSLYNPVSISICILHVGDVLKDTDGYNK